MPFSIRHECFSLERHKCVGKRIQFEKSAVLKRKYAVWCPSLSVKREKRSTNEFLCNLLTGGRLKSFLAKSPLEVTFKVFQYEKYCCLLCYIADVIVKMTLTFLLKLSISVLLNLVSKRISYFMFLFNVSLYMISL